MLIPYILPYRKGSKSVKALSEALGCKQLKLEGSKFVHRPDQLVINWGCNNGKLIKSIVNPDCNGLNSAWWGDDRLCVSVATNKLGFFHIMKEKMPECIPDYTESIEEAAEWCKKGTAVVCRTMLNASGGKGIVIADTPEQLVRAPLYVKYIKKEDEYRVHVFAGKVIDTQRKMRKKDVPDADVNWRVRNHDNGFVFGRDGINPPDGIGEMCIKAVEELGLDFGAVDVIHNKHSNKLLLLEVNTAPGLEGTTLEKYSKAITTYCNQ